MTTTHGILLDTHVWVWLEKADPLITPAIRKHLDFASKEGRLFLASISLLEMVNMHRKGRLALPIPMEQWFLETLAGDGLQLLQITSAIALETAHLPESFHGDPADRLIAATARVENLTLCTHDKALLMYGKQGLYRTLPV